MSRARRKESIMEENVAYKAGKNRLTKGWAIAAAIFAAVLYLLALVSVISAAVTGRHRH